jgi:hypothetical protein
MTDTDRTLLECLSVVLAPPSKHFIASDIPSVNGVHTPTRRDSPYWCKGAELEDGFPAGVLEVHLIEDREDVWYRMHLKPGTRTSALFDKYRSSEKVDLSKVFIFPL